MPSITVDCVWQAGRVEDTAWGVMTTFYNSLRWPGWEAEVTSTSLDRGINTFPPLWTTEGKDLSTVSRRAIRMAELVAYHHEMAGQFDALSE